MFTLDLSNDVSPLPAQQDTFISDGPSTPSWITLDGATPTGPYMWANYPEGVNWDDSGNDDFVFNYALNSATTGSMARFGFNIQNKGTSTDGQLNLWVRSPSGTGSIGVQLDSGSKMAGLGFKTSTTDPLEEVCRRILTNFYAGGGSMSSMASLSSTWQMIAIVGGAITAGVSLGPLKHKGDLDYATGLLQFQISGDVQFALAFQTDSTAPGSTLQGGVDADVGRTRGCLPSWAWTFAVNTTATDSTLIPLTFPADPNQNAGASYWWKHGNGWSGTDYATVDWANPVAYCSADLSSPPNPPLTHYLRGNYELEETYYVMAQNLSANPRQYVLIAFPQAPATHTPPNGINPPASAGVNAFLNLYDLTFSNAIIPKLPPTPTLGFQGAGWFDKVLASPPQSPPGACPLRDLFVIHHDTIPGCTIECIQFTVVVANSSQGYFNFALVPVGPPLSSGPPYPTCTSYTTNTCTPTTTTTTSTTSTTTTSTTSTTPVSTSTTPAETTTTSTTSTTSTTTPTTSTTTTSTTTATTTATTPFCLDADSTVLLSGGMLKRAADVLVGDILLGRDGCSGWRDQIVTEVFSSIQPRYRLRHMHGEFVCSGSHCVELFDGRTIPVQNLVAGVDALITAELKPSLVQSVVRVEDGEVFGWSCSPDHVFIACGVLHHNKTKSLTSATAMTTLPL